MTSRYKQLIYLTLISFLGLIYYGLYYNCGFNIGDEGSVALISQRLLAGEIPFKELFIGYNLLWFDPIVLLFKLFGTNFSILKIYFFSLAILSALFCYLTVLRLTQKYWLAFAGSLLLILVPGTIHKSYIPLIVIANTFFILRVIDADRRRLFRAAIISSSANSIGCLIRPDLGILFTAVLFSAIFLKTFFTAFEIQGKDNPTSKLLFFLKVSAVMCLTHLFANLPFLVVAYWHGFLPEFLSQYSRHVVSLINIVERANPFKFMLSGLDQAMDHSQPPGTLLRLTPFHSMWRSGQNHAFAFLTYMPIFVMTIYSLRLLSKAYGRLGRRPLFTNELLRDYVLLAAALSAFPQFFLFRPDIAHLSQFMPGYIVLVFYLISKSLSQITRRTSITLPSASLKPMLSLVVLIALALHVFTYGVYAMRHSGAGTVFVKEGRHKLFEAENGVKVYLNQNEYNGLTTITKAVKQFSSDKDCLLCFPYCPGINFMTNRKTYMKKLYVDDGILIKEPNWQNRIIEDMRKRKPAIVIYSDWAINGTEISRFSNWAKAVKEFVVGNYSYYGKVMDFHVYIHPNSVPVSK